MDEYEAQLELVIPVNMKFTWISNMSEYEIHQMCPDLTFKHLRLDAIVLYNNIVLPMFHENRVQSTVFPLLNLFLMTTVYESKCLKNWITHHKSFFFRVKHV